jgi:LPXTG-motif cell wall-anchored protein
MIPLPGGGFYASAWLGWTGVLLIILGVFIFLKNKKSLQ